MKKISIFITVIAVNLLFLCISCTTCFAKDIKGDGKLVTKSITISDFSKIEIETYVVIDYSQEKNTGNLEFTVDNNLFEYYDIHTKGNVLYIELKNEYKKTNIHPKPTKSMVTVSSKQLEGIEIAGSSIFNFRTAFTSTELNIELAGSGKIFANKFPVKIESCEIEIAGSGNVHLLGTIHKANIEVAGSGKVDLTGTIQEAEIEIAGSGRVSALDCKITRLSVDIAGSGTVEAQVTDKLDVDLAGSGSMKFKGNPEIKSNVSGSGKVVKL